MALTTGETFWDKTAEAARTFPPLQQNVHTDVLVIGGGMSGTLTAHVLAKAGKQVTVIDRGAVGEGSSSANTGLLQYASDTMLSEFVDRIGEKDAVLFYRMCLEAMDELTELAGELPDTAEYRLRDSIYYASSEEDVDKLKREYSYLKKYDFPAEYLSHAALQAEYGVDKPAAIRTWHDAEVNPYRFIQAVTEKNVQLGVSYYEQTEADLHSLEDHMIHTAAGNRISYGAMVLATGYGTVFEEIAHLASITQTFALATEPLEEPLWTDRVMVWETKKPYLYFRTTKDGRIIAGGLDEKSDALHEDPSVIRSKAEEILKEVQDIFPQADVKIAAAWNSLFGVSRDGLPFIGPSQSGADVYCLLGYEGNGTCYSMAGAKIILDLIDGVTNEYAAIVDPGR
ncbi:oxidoreductase [Sporosarcina sp. NCCP-2716]|uniref:NAD(P)/FAD-dependent oxidoreductase n=1 Tax=Sporosarcina sp. NCCP-2716 TaxID=2943679 RepID=UPI00203A8EB2|nr:FAD-dependent oxidoreductase [Sporosarcina sp. NCCP-2716]GKV69461.1 oxidoreductase [Sporosarcina sp. NCCP-2716]